MRVTIDRLSQSVAVCCNLTELAINYLISKNWLAIVQWKCWCFFHCSNALCSICFLSNFVALGVIIAVYLLYRINLHLTLRKPQTFIAYNIVEIDELHNHDNDTMHKWEFY